MPSMVGLCASLDQLNSPSLISNTWDAVSSRHVPTTHTTTYHISINKVGVQSYVSSIRLQLITLKKGLDALGRDNSFNGLVCEHSDLKTVRGHIVTIAIAESRMGTIASGNCSSMNNEIAGNIMSLVNGFEDILAAVAKELNATSTARHPTRSNNNQGAPSLETPTWNATPKCCVQCLHSMSSKSNRRSLCLDNHSQRRLRFS